MYPLFNQHLLGACYVLFIPIMLVKQLLCAVHSFNGNMAYNAPGIIPWLPYSTVPASLCQQTSLPLPAIPEPRCVPACALVQLPSPLLPPPPAPAAHTGAGMRALVGTHGHPSGVLAWATPSSKAVAFPVSPLAPHKIHELLCVSACSNQPPTGSLP